MAKGDDRLGRYSRSFASLMRKLERSWPLTMVLMLLVIILLSTLRPA